MIVRLTRKEANAFVTARHRHHKAVVGDMFRCGLTLRGELVGVVIAGRPIPSEPHPSMSPRRGGWGGGNECLERDGARARPAAIRRIGEDAGGSGGASRKLAFVVLKRQKEDAYRMKMQAVMNAVDASNTSGALELIGAEMDRSKGRRNEDARNYQLS